MGNQKQAVMDLVERHRDEGRRISEVLESVGVARSSYYRWRKGQGEKTERWQSSYQITEDERRLIEEVKEAHPEYRHRRIQGVLQSKGVYLSGSAI
jgi:transposase